MINLVKKFNLLFFIFINFVFLIAVFWLYQKHNVGNDSTISEWMINYQGGFTRRGIIGEICFQLAVFFDLNLRFVIFLFQSSIYLLFSILVYFFIKDTAKNILIIVAILSPLFFLFPIAEIESLARKEIFLFVGFIIFLNLSNVKKSINQSLIYIFFAFPLLCLIWEPFLFFFPFSIFVILIRNNEEKLKEISLKILLSFSSSMATLLIIFLNKLTIDEHTLMVNSLMNNFGELCYMSCSLLGSKTSMSAQFMPVLKHFSLEVFFRYSIIIFIGFLPLFILLFNTKNKNTLMFLESTVLKYIFSKEETSLRL